MALIAMCVYSTDVNKKDLLLERTLESLRATVDFTKHRLILSVNGYTNKTKSIFKKYEDIISDIIYNGDNLGTAKGVNQAWLKRKAGENAVKMDDDVVIHNAGWLDDMELAVSKDPKIGIIGLKRNDIWQCPTHPDAFYRSQLTMLPHLNGEPWLIIEKTADIMGTCVLHTSALLDKVGFMYQPGLYGFDDVLFCHRALVAGFYNCFLSGVKIDHIDDGSTPWQKAKEKLAGDKMQQFHNMRAGMSNGTVPIYYKADY